MDLPPLITEPEHRGVVAVDLSCIECGYSLRSLPAAGVCSECGSPVPPSLNRDRLLFADPAWLGRVGSGAGVLCLWVPCVAVGLFIMALLGSFSGHHSSGVAEFFACFFLGVIVLWYGLLPFVTPRPGQARMVGASVAAVLGAAAITAAILLGAAATMRWAVDRGIAGPAAYLLAYGGVIALAAGTVILSARWAASARARRLRVLALGTLAVAIVPACYVAACLGIVVVGLLTPSAAEDFNRVAAIASGPALVVLPLQLLLLSVLWPLTMGMTNRLLGRVRKGAVPADQAVQPAPAGAASA